MKVSDVENTSKVISAMMEGYAEWDRSLKSVWFPFNNLKDMEQMVPR